MISYSSTTGSGKSDGKIVASEGRNIYGYMGQEIGARCKSADASKSVLRENDI